MGSGTKDQIQGTSDDQSLIQADDDLDMAASIIGGEEMPLVVESKGKVSLNAGNGAWVVSDEDITIDKANSDTTISVASMKKLSLDNLIKNGLKKIYFVE